VTRAPWLIAAGAWVVTALVVASPASAGNLSVRTSSTSATLTYSASPGDRDGVDVQLEDAAVPGVYLVSLRPGTNLGPGCEPYSGNPRRAARCTLPAGVAHQVDIRLGDRNDGAGLEHVPQLGGRVMGGPGDDVITGPGNRSDGGLPLWLWYALAPPQPRLHDAMAGESAAAVHAWGGPGADELWGGLGDDVLEPGPGVDYVVGTGGDDKVASADRDYDYIECDSGRDTLTLDRRDLAWGRCGAARRRGAPMAVPLNVLIDWEDLEDTIIIIGCPADMPTACRGRLTISVHNGRTVLRGRFRVHRGRIGDEREALDYPEMRAIVRHKAVLTLQTRDGAGRLRSISRVIPVEGEPIPD
jgi:RTX calcium-binding nonapeptide repeat (4 copies)